MSNKVKIGKKKNKKKDKAAQTAVVGNDNFFDKQRVDKNKDIKVSNRIYRGKTG